MALRLVAKAALEQLPFKREIFGGIRVLGTPSGYRHLRFDGPFRMPLPGGASIKLLNSDRYSLATEYFWRGVTGWEAVSISVWINLCRLSRLDPVPVVLDVGACEGVYALTAKALRPDARVLAFEPLPSAYRLLALNRELNGNEIETVQAACSDFDGNADLYFTSEDSTEASLIESGSNSAEVPRTRVAVRKLNTLLSELGATKVDFIKIDTEGAEDKVLVGMCDLLPRCRPVMILEVLSEDAATALNEIIQPLDYCCWDINDDPSKGPLGLRAAPRISKGICLNWLLVPHEKVRLYEPCWRDLVLE